MKRVLAVLALSGLMACTTGRPCTSDSECTAFQAVCDPELKVCVSATDPDGGSACGSGCADWQTCRPGAGGGSCVGLTVRIVSPLPNTEYGGSASVRLVASVTDWDGGAWGGTSIPASGSTGVAAPASLMRIGAGQYQGDYGLPDTAGTHTLIAGWSGASASVPVVTQVCSVACADWQECLPSANGGVCGDLGLTLTWNSPAANAKFPTNVSVPLALAVTRADGGAFARDIPFTVTSGSPGMLSPAGGNSWTGSTNSGSVDTTRTLVAGWAGGPQSSGRDFIVDATPPALSLVVRTDGGSYQRDAIIPALLVSSEDLADAGVTLGGVAMPRVADINCPDFGATAGAAGCFELDFSRPTLDGLDGGLVVGLSGTDLYANSVSSDGGALQATRVRWTSPGNARRVQALAVGSDGMLYVGTSGVASELFALTAAGDAGPVSNIGEVQSIAVAPSTTEDLIYLAYNTTGTIRGNIGALESGSLTVGALAGPCQGAIGSQTYSGIALFDVAGETVAIGSVNSVVGVGGKGCLYHPTNGQTSFGGASVFDSVAVAGPVGAAANVLVAGQEASFLKHGEGLDGGAWWQPVSLDGIAVPTQGTPVRLTSLAAFPASGQALAMDRFLVATTSAGSGNQLFSLGDAGVLAAGSIGSDMTDKGVPALSSLVEGYVGQGESLVRFNPSMLGGAAVDVGAVASDSIRTSPVLGAARGTGGQAEGYAISRAGVLLAFTQGSGTEKWRSSLLQPGDTVVTHMAFDCNRTRPASGTGVLYVGASSGKVLSIIVDSPKLLDSPNAWPKYQRSMGNAGNDDLTNFPTNWPGCP